MVLWITAALFFITSLTQLGIGIGRVLTQRELIDFSVYHQASQTVLSSQNPYTQSYGDNILFNYPPSSLLFFIPFGMIPQPASQTIFSMLSLISLLLSAGILIFNTRNRPNWTVLLVIFGLLLQNFPTKFTLILGQVNLFVLFFLVLSFYFEQRGKPIISGLFWGMGSMIKLTPLYLGIYFLMRKRYTTLASGVLLFVISNILPLVIFVREPTFFYENLPRLAVQTVTTTSIYDQSLRAFIARVWRNDIAVQLSLFFVIILTIIAVTQYNMLKEKKSLSWHRNLTFFSLILAIVTIGNSYTWHHHLVFLFPGFIVEMLHVLKTKQVIPGVLLFFSALLVGYHFPDPSHPPTSNPILLSHALAGTLLLIALLLWQQGIRKVRVLSL